MHTRTIEVSFRRHRLCSYPQHNFKSPPPPPRDPSIIRRFQVKKDSRISGPPWRYRLHRRRPLSLLSRAVSPKVLGFFLLGNHEPCHLNFPAVKSRMRAFADRIEAKRRTPTIGRFIFLDQTRYDMSGYRLTVLGYTLFSHITKERAAPVASRSSASKI